MYMEHVAAFHTTGLRGKNLQATRCVLGGKSRVRYCHLILTPLFRPLLIEPKGVVPMKELLRLLLLLVMDELFC